MSEPSNDDTTTRQPDDTADGDGRADSTAAAADTAGPDEMYCHDCGELISAKAEICPACGVRQRDPPGSALDTLIEDLTAGGNPFIAGVASAVFPGVGQLYNRELGRAIAFMAGAFLAALSSLVAIGLVLYPIVWLWAIYDAYKGAERYAAAEGDAEADVDA